MNIVFFEVRSKTKLYEKIALELVAKHPNLRIHWIVQNSVYKPRGGRGEFHFLKKVKAKTVKSFLLSDMQKRVARSDRFVIHCNEEPSHYFETQKEIEEIFDTISPTHVFGELGNYFTHLGALICKSRGIPFFDVESARFPSGCLSFYQYDRWLPLKIRGEVAENEVDEFLTNYLSKSMKIDYMQKQRGFLHEFRKLNDKVKVLCGYILGDVHCTQHPIENLLKKRQVAKKVKAWRACSSSWSSVIKSGKKIALYPMQMQPEFNLEVWGWQYSDQSKLIDDLCASLPDDCVLVIKANPKAYFEMLPLNVLELASRNNVFLLNFDEKMSDIQAEIDLAITVTGTIQIERLLHNQDVLILGDTPFREFSYDYVPDGSPLTLQECLKEFAERKFCEKRECVNNNRKVARYLLEHSLPGLIAEPIHDYRCLSPSNIELVSQAFSKVIFNENIYNAK